MPKPGLKQSLGPTHLTPGAWLRWQVQEDNSSWQEVLKKNKVLCWYFWQKALSSIFCFKLIFFFLKRESQEVKNHTVRQKFPSLHLSTYHAAFTVHHPKGRRGENLSYPIKCWTTKNWQSTKCAHGTPSSQQRLHCWWGLLKSLMKFLFWSRTKSSIEARYLGCSQSFLVLPAFKGLDFVSEGNHLFPLVSGQMECTSAPCSATSVYNSVRHHHLLCV